MKLSETFFFGYLELKWRRLAKFISFVSVATGYGVVIFTDNWELEFVVLVIASPVIIAVLSWLLQPFVIDKPERFHFNDKDLFSVKKVPKSPETIKYPASYQKEISKLYPYISNITLIIVDIVAFLIVFALISNQNLISNNGNSAKANFNHTVEKEINTQIKKRYTFKDSIDEGWAQITKYYDPDVVKYCKKGFEKGYTEDEVFVFGINAGYSYSEVTHFLEFYEIHRKFERVYGDLVRDCQNSFEKGNGKQAIISAARIRGYSEKSIVAALKWYENSLECSIRKDNYGYYDW